jgi:hypothetical protein
MASLDDRFEGPPSEARAFGGIGPEDVTRAYSI